MKTVSELKQKIKELKDDLEVYEVELKHAEELERRLHTFRSAVLAQYKIGEITDLGFDALADATGFARLEKNEQVSVSEENTEAA